MKFSLIIPVYNVAEYLRECLDSVIAQSYADWEAICVDDGSDDGCAAILDEYATNDVRFRVVHQENAGVSVARNVALDMAHGEWITFLDADDKIEKWRLEFLASVIKQHPSADWIRETLYSTNSDGVSYTHSNAVVRREIGKNDVYLYGWQTQKSNALLCLNSFKNKTVQPIRFPVGVRYAEDDIYEWRCLSSVTSCVEVGFGGYWYRDDRIGAASRVIRLEDSVKIHQALLDIVEEQSNCIDAVPKDEFSAVFTQTVRKDFERVFRRWYSNDKNVRHRHAALSRQIYNSPYFNPKCVDGFGYVIYMRTGIMSIMIVEDLVLRAIGKLCRTCKSLTKKG